MTSPSKRMKKILKEEWAFLYSKFIHTRSRPPSISWQDKRSYARHHVACYDCGSDLYPRSVRCKNQKGGGSLGEPEHFVDCGGTAKTHTAKSPSIIDTQPTALHCSIDEPMKELPKIQDFIRTSITAGGLMFPFQNHFRQLLRRADRLLLLQEARQ